MIDACEIPTDILNNMSTQALLKTVLNYPLLIDLYAYDITQKGFNAVSTHFNGLVELQNRIDAPKHILETYKNLNIVSSKSQAINYQDIFDSDFLEILLFQDSIVQKMSALQTKELNIEISNERARKNRYKEVYGSFSDRYYNLQIEEFSGITNVMVRGAVAGTVYTPKGTAVTCAGMDSLWPMQITELNNRFAATFPKAVRKREPTSNYNCHSYAWYSQYSDNNRWINDPTAYMKDGSYREITTPDIGDKVYYDNPNEHSAVFTGTYPITNTQIHVNAFREVWSKWAAGGLYEHTINYCPYFYNNIQVEFYRRSFL